MLGMGSASTQVDSTSTEVVRTSPNRRAVLSTTTYAVDSATITEVNVCNSGILVLPPSTYVCGVHVENFNVVRGAESITNCSSGGGGFFDSDNPPTSSHCAGVGVSGSCAHLDRLKFWNNQVFG